MSLSLLEGYSSSEEEPAPTLPSEFSSSSDDDDTDHPNNLTSSFNPLLAPSNSSKGRSVLPSAFDAFSQISAPPQFLNNSVEDQSSIEVRDSAAFWGRRKSKDKNDLPPGAVIESKAQLVGGMHERVRSDVEGKASSSASDETKKGSSATLPEGGKRVITAGNPDAKDASELLRMCLQCGVPKTYSNARGMVCPECGDRPPTDEALKKKGSTVKDKEKVKRMRGQSSHASWKSETEMQLRQQFD